MEDETMRNLMEKGIRESYRNAFKSGYQMLVILLGELDKDSLNLSPEQHDAYRKMIGNVWTKSREEFNPDLSQDNYIGGCQDELKRIMRGEK